MAQEDLHRALNSEAKYEHEKLRENLAGIGQPGGMNTA